MAIPLYLLDASIALLMDPDANFRNISPPKDDDLGVRCILRDIQADWVRLFCEGAEDSSEKQDMIRRVAEHLRHTILYYSQYFRDTLARGLLIRAGNQVCTLQQYVEVWEIPAPDIEETLGSCRQLLRSHGILDDDLDIPMPLWRSPRSTAVLPEDGIQATGTRALW